MQKGKINEKQKLFAQNYVQSLNAYQSAIKAGYSENYAKVFSCKLLEDIRIKEYIKELASKETNSRLATIDDINTFWSDLMFDTSADIKDRLKASELRGKVLGAFTENIKLTLPKQLAEVHNKLEKALFDE